MFGWEFPPHNSGGLGTACFGLTKALGERNADITFVLPKQVGVSSDFVRIMFADTVPGVTLRSVDAALSPYMTATLYEKFRRGLESVIYGASLMEEVLRYAMQARRIAREEAYDVIHAHDWLSFPAGVEAKKASGKPLVVHVHATEFDRTGGHAINQDVYAVEWEGMHAADRIVAVSNFTKNIIISHYGVDPARVTVVHNGVDPSTCRKS